MNIKQVQAQKGSQSYLSWYKSRDWHCFFNERFFQNEKGCRLEKNKKNNERTKWVVQRNKKGLFFKTNEKKQQQKDLKLSERTKTKTNKKELRFYWTNYFTEWSFSANPSKKDGKWRIILRVNKINFFWTIEKNERNGSFTNDEETKWKKSKLTISRYTSYSLIYSLIHFSKFEIANFISGGVFAKLGGKTQSWQFCKNVRHAIIWKY